MDLEFKHILTILTMVILTGSWLATGKWPVLDAEFPTFIGALLAIAGMHHGADLANNKISGPAPKEEVEVQVKTE